MTSKLTEELEEGLERDTVRRALGNELAGRGWRTAKVWGLDASVDDEEPGKFPGTLGLRGIGAEGAEVEVEARGSKDGIS